MKKLLLLIALFLLPLQAQAWTLNGDLILLGDERISDGNGILDNNGNEQLLFSTTASAVNEVTVKNAATGNAPQLQVTGGDTNISLNLVPKGNGSIRYGGAEILRTDGLTSVSNNTQRDLTNSSTGSFANVTGMALTFTVNVPGKYLVICNFDHQVLLDGASSVARVAFRLNDGTNSSSTVFSGGELTGTGDSQTLTDAISIVHIFDFSTGGSKTVNLQFRNIDFTNVLENLVRNNYPGAAAQFMQVVRVAD